MRKPAQTHEIPTHLDVQDKLLLGLTVRQSLHLLAGLAASLALWRELALWSGVPLTVRASTVGLCLVATALLVLVRPDRRGLDAWTVIVLRYATSPSVCVWRAQGGLRHDGTHSEGDPSQWATYDRPAASVAEVLGGASAAAPWPAWPACRSAQAAGTEGCAEGGT